MTAVARWTEEQPMCPAMPIRQRTASTLQMLTAARGEAHTEETAKPTDLYGGKTF